MTITVLYALTDTRINSAAAGTNYGTGNNIRVGESNAAAAKSRGLIKFSGLYGGEIPADAMIASAIASLYLTVDIATNARTQRWYRFKSAWSETQATWNERSTGYNWTAAGAFGTTNCEQTDIGSRSMSADEAVNEYKDFVLSPSAIQEIVSGAFTNNGFLIKADTESDDQYQYNSREAASNPPILTINWSLPNSGSHCAMLSDYAIL